MNEEKNISNLEVMRGIVSQMTSVPAELLTGETVAEIKAQADALKDWADDGNGVKTPRDQFVSWMNGENCEQPDGGAMPEPDAPHGKYPAIKDGGEPSHVSTFQSAKESFADYFRAFPFSRY